MSAAEELVRAQAGAGRVWLGDLGEAERVLSADFIREFCLGVDVEGLGARGLWLAGGRVEGVLDFVLCTLARPLAFESMTFEERPNFGACHLPGLAFIDCDLPGLAARDLETAHIMSLRSCRIDDGTVELGRARIGGDLDLSGAHIKGKEGSALLAGGASVAGDILLDRGFVADGQIRLVQAKVGSDLNCDGATISALDNDEGVLVGDGAEINGNVLLTGGFAATGAVRFVAAEIRGALRCSGAELANPEEDALLLRRTRIAGNLGLDSTTATGQIELIDVSIGDSLIVSGATLDNGNRNALVADGAQVARNVELGEGFTSTGTVRLVGVRIGGDLHCSAGQISNPSALALVLDRAEIEGNANLDDGFKAEGTVRLVGAHIGGELNCGFATLTAERTHALACDRAVVDSNVNLGPGFSANGIVSFVHAKVGGGFDCSAAKVWNPTGLALAADALEVGASMLFGEEFEAFGEVRLVGARVRSELDLSGGRFENLHKVALRAAQVDAGALLLRNTRLRGGVSLFKAHAGVLHDDLAPGSSVGSWSTGGPLLLAGFSYDRFGPGTTWDSNLRFAWLKETEAFDPGAWQQLINVYRLHGRDEDGRRAAVAREDDRLKRAGLSRTRIAGRWILRATIGYGYRPWIAGLWALAVIALFTVALSLGPNLVPEPKVTGSPNLVIYAADTFLPIVDLGEASRWSPVGWLEWVEWLVILLGWALTTIFVAGFTRIVRS